MSSLSSILLGIDVGVMSGAKVFFVIGCFLYHSMYVFHAHAYPPSCDDTPQEYMTPDLGLSTVQEEVMKHMQQPARLTV